MRVLRTTLVNVATNYRAQQSNEKFSGFDAKVSPSFGYSDAESGWIAWLRSLWPKRNGMSLAERKVRIYPLVRYIIEALRKLRGRS